MGELERDWLGELDAEGEFDAVPNCVPDGLVSWLAAIVGVDEPDSVGSTVDVAEGVQEDDCVAAELGVGRELGVALLLGVAESVDVLSWLRVSVLVCDAESVCVLEVVSACDRESVWLPVFVCVCVVVGVSVGEGVFVFDRFEGVPVKDNEFELGGATTGSAKAVRINVKALASQGGLRA